MMFRIIQTAALIGSMGLFACGSGGAKKPKPTAGYNVQNSGNAYSGYPQETPCTMQQCDRVTLQAQSGTGAGILQGYVNQPADWQIMAVTTPYTSSRVLLITATGGPSQCTWSGAAGSVSCSFQPTSTENNTTPIQISMLDASYCRFQQTSSRGNPSICDSIESAQSTGLVQTATMSWTIADAPANGQFDPNQFSLPPVKDRSTQLCAMNALGAFLPALGGNLLGGLTGGITGCLQGYMQGQQLADQQRMMQQQFQYQQLSGQSNPYQQFGQPQYQQPYSGYGLTGAGSEDDEEEYDDSHE